MTPCGEWINGREGVGFEWHQIRITRPWWKLWLPSPVWEFQLIQTSPLTWLDYRPGYEGYWRPDAWRITDGGSIPWPVDRVLPESEFPASYSMHDSAWDSNDGNGTGLYWSASVEGPYIFKSLSRHEANVMLAEGWVPAEGGKEWECKAIYAGVEIGRAFRRGR